MIDGGAIENLFKKLNSILSVISKNKHQQSNILTKENHVIGTNNGNFFFQSQNRKKEKKKGQTSFCINL